MVRGLPPASRAKATLPASIAVLPCSRAMVFVGPPLFVSGPSVELAFGTPTWLLSVPFVSPPAEPASPIRLNELTAATVPAMSLGVAPLPVPKVLSATIALLKVAAPAPITSNPPPELKPVALL